MSDEPVERGLASRLSAERDRQSAKARPGEGADTDELARLIALIRTTEAQSAAAARTIQIGEFTVDATRVPVGFVAHLRAITRTEAAALRFLGWGRANADIAIMLGMTESTVRSHFNNVVNKLGVDGMRELNSLAGLLFHPLE